MNEAFLNIQEIWNMKLKFPFFSKNENHREILNKRAVLQFIFQVMQHTLLYAEN